MQAMTWAGRERGGTDWLVSIEGLRPPFDHPRSHATTLAAAPGGLVLAFFGGEVGGRQDIWTLRKGPLGWSGAVRAAQQGRLGERCWNPVLHRTGSGELLLFYKVGFDPATWTGHLVRSQDHGRTWSSPEQLPGEMLGPVRGRPLPLPGGALLCGASTELGPWQVHFETLAGDRRTWTATPPLADPHELGAIQPACVDWQGGVVQALCRTRTGSIAESWSHDGGRSWSALRATALPNPNSAIDALRLSDGRALLAYNPTALPERHARGRRSPIALAITKDGHEWRPVGLLEDDIGPDAEFSYPAMLARADGTVVVSYTTDRDWSGIRVVTVDPRKMD